MKVQWIFIAMLALFTLACGSNNSEPDPELVEEIQALESTTEEMEAVQTDIESTAAEVDSLLNEIETIN